MTFKPLPLTSSDGEFKPLPLTSSDGSFKPLPLSSPKEIPEQQEPPFMARHPNLYATGATVKGMIMDAPKLLPYIKYFYKEEQEKFLTLDKQHQVRELLKENLFSQLFLVPGSKGFKHGFKKAGGWFAKTFPKTAKSLTKPRMVSKLKLEEAAIEVEKQTPAVKKIIAALKEAKPIRKEQEAIYTKVRGERLRELIEVGKKTSGEEGFYKQLGTLKGKMPKVQFESIRKQFGQEEVNALFNQIKTSSLGEWEKLPASKGLAKIFGEYGGGVPTEGELAHLSEVFGSEFVKTTLAQREMFAKFKAAGLEIANIPRAIMASFDLSAPLRQGVFLVGKPKHWFSAFKSMFKPAVSERAYQQLHKGIRSRPTFGLMQENKLAITELGSLTSREERFMSNWAEKIPVIGRGVRGSGRAYTSFLNKIRADFFDEFVEKGVKLGIKDPKFLKDAAKYINHATGRGGLGDLESAAVPLNTWFFSPRLTMSRLQMLNPKFYGSLEPTVRKEALKNLFTFGSVALGSAGLMKYGGADVNLDPRNADFMKPKIGNTRYDILGGFQQPIRLAAQLISGKVISSTTGKTMVLGEGYRGLTRTEIISRFLEYKQAPVISFAVNLIRGQTSLGEKTDVPTETMNRFVPMVVRDIYDLYKEEGLKGIPMAVPAIFGVGVQSYGGVSSFGLDGKDYPKLNKELSRLKTSMGYPSISAFGQPLNNKEFKALKLKTGRVVANDLREFMSSELYRETPDQHKVKLIEQRIDETKQMVKEKMFPDKERKSDYMKDLKDAGYSGEEVNKLADEYLKRN